VVLVLLPYSSLEVEKLGGLRQHEGIGASDSSSEVLHRQVGAFDEPVDLLPPGFGYRPLENRLFGSLRGLREAVCGLSPRAVPCDRPVCDGAGRAREGGSQEVMCFMSEDGAFLGWRGGKRTPRGNEQWKCWFTQLCEVLQEGAR